MHFSNQSSVVALLREQRRRSLDMVIGGEMMASIVQTILSVLVGVETSIDDRATGTARCGTCESLVEFGAFRSELVQVGCLNLGISITAQLLAEIIGDHQQNVFLRHDEIRFEVIPNTFEQISPLAKTLTILLIYELSRISANVRARGANGRISLRVSLFYNAWWSQNGCLRNIANGFGDISICQEVE